MTVIVFITIDFLVEFRVKSGQQPDKNDDSLVITRAAGFGYRLETLKGLCN